MDYAVSEQLKQLKARYCRLLDAKDWSAWRELFTDDFIGDTTESGGKRVEGADAFVSYVRAMLGKPARITVHQVHAPELTLTTATTASGIWAMEDVVRLAPALSLRGYGHYRETYRLVDGDWRLASSRLTRLRMDLVTPLLTLKMPAGLLRRPPK